MAKDLPAWTIADFIHRGYWWENRGILLLNLYLLIPLLSSTVNGYDSSLINGLQILPMWQQTFGDPRGIPLGLISAAQMVGGLIALPVAPYFSDWFGRRFSLFLGAVVMLAGVSLQATATTLSQFIGARALLGAGLQTELNSAPLLVLELSYPTQRGKLTSIYNSLWYSGSVLAAWTCFGAYNGAKTSQWSWRIPSIVQAFGPLLQISMVWFMPESPRWLISTGRESQAARILSKFHANGYDERDPLVVFEMAQIRYALKMERDTSQVASFLTLFRTPGNRKRMRIILAIAIFSQWSGNGLVSYYINLVLEGVGFTQSSTKAAINGALQIWNLICAITGASLVDKLGRRAIFLMSNAGMLITFSAWTLTTALFNTIHSTQAAKATIPFIFLFYLFYDLAYAPMIVSYTLEILPFNIRAKGFALLNITISLTLAFNQFVNPWALDAIGWKYYLVYCGWLGIELIFVLKYVIETRGRTLEETAVLFDGEDFPAEIELHAGEAATVTMELTRADNRMTDVANADAKTVDDKRSSAISSNHTHELPGLSRADSWVRPSSSGSRPPPLADGGIGVAL
ncbi:general substrate transporter [Vararia minispora EC-137]|uniref:General substrate transporter n=1 Tax=Vararia minispora EC-137 TaxID=1314806 RepID=A0ACB8QDH5_9AGAM|nr:general substrate transporter [Vararia minispora EC-137]